VNRQSSPMFLRVSIGLGLATAAITSTLRADPGLLAHLHESAASQSASADPASIAVPDPRADFAFSRQAGRSPSQGRPVGVSQTSSIASSAAAPNAPAAPRRPAAHPLTHPPSQPSPQSSAPTPIYAATSESIAAHSAPAQSSTVSAVTAQYQHPDDRGSHQNGRQQTKPARQSGAHLDGWRVAGHGSTFDGGHGSHRTPRHRQG
jgi:hypothetical protein